jgi:hypothetical protein
VNSTPLARFIASTAGPDAPEGLDAPLAAMWWLRRGDWARAHAIVQLFGSGSAAWVHAHLHRVERDRENAGYWYARAGRRVATDALDAEWERIVAALLSDS